MTIVSYVKCECKECNYKWKYDELSEPNPMMQNSLCNTCNLNRIGKSKLNMNTLLNDLKMLTLLLRESGHYKDIVKLMKDRYDLDAN